MQKKYLLYFFALLIGFTACDNDVDITADFEDTTVIYSLINAYEDTQFVKVNRAFLQDGVSAIDLAKETDRLFYDNLEVTLVSRDRPNATQQDNFILSTIEKPKEPGVFSTEKNILYYTDGNLAANTTYDLTVKQPEGKVSSAVVRTLSRPNFIRPRYIPQSMKYSQVSFVSDLGGIIDYEFEVVIKSEMNQVQLNMAFLYDEVISGNKVRRSVDIPIGIISNVELADDAFSLVYPGNSFFQRVGANLPNNGNEIEIPLNDNIILRATAVDATYSQYTSIYGPIDGIAQVRPEYTNVQNGVGLVASRSSQQIVTLISDNTRNKLKRDFGFVDPN